MHTIATNVAQNGLPPAITAPIAPLSPHARQQVLSALKARWDRGEPADAQAVLRQHPELAGDKTALLEVVYEEYCQRVERGETVDTTEYGRRYPRFQSSLQRLFTVHSFVAHQAGLQAPPADAAWPQLSSIYRGFEMLDELGRGGFARVYLARELAVGNRLVALKVAPQVEREAALLGRLDHPNIVPILSVLSEPSPALSLICMPFRGRATLEDVLNALAASPTLPASAEVVAEVVQASAAADNDDQLANSAELGVPQRYGHVEAVVWICRQVCDGLAAAHRQGILHLDLKPSNVLLAAEGRPMLLDFNLSVDAAFQHARIGGTLPYMSPEQLRAMFLNTGGQPAVDARSDVFSLGVMLYELLTGVHPFGDFDRQRPPAELAAELLQRQTAGPLPIAERNRLVNTGLRRLVESCLACDSNARPQSATEMSALLGRQLHVGPRLRRWQRLHPRRARLATATMLLGAVALGMAWAGRPALSERELAAGQAALAAGEVPAAITHFDQALAADQQLNAAHLARGRALLRAERFDEAVVDFQLAARAKPSAAALRGQAYGLAKLKQYADAERCLRRVLEMGTPIPGDYNNLAYCLLPTKREAEAEELLCRAIAAADAPASAFYNRARIELQRTVKLPEGERFPRQAIEDIEQALGRGLRHGEVYFTAACLAAMASEIEPERETAMLDYLRDSVKHGIVLSEPQKKTFFKRFAAQPTFLAAIAGPPGVPDSFPAERLVRP